MFYTKRIIILAALLVVGLSASAQLHYTNTTLVSGFGSAQPQDPFLLLPFGLAQPTAGTVWWVANSGSSTATVYDDTGRSVGSPGGPLVVHFHQPSLDASPVGVTFNPTHDFLITDGVQTAPAIFIFSTQEGLIEGWSPVFQADITKQNAVVAVSTTGASYGGMTIVNVGGASVLYVANSASGHIEAFDSQFHPLPLPATAFADPAIIATPLNIQVINGNLYVTFTGKKANAHAEHDDDAEQNDKGDDDDDGKNNNRAQGFVDVFDVNGVLLQRIRHNRLQTPWGVAWAPSNFGVFSGALLVGDSTTGQISAFDSVRGGFLGVLQDTTNRPLVVPQIHGMAFGSGNGNGPTNSLFFVSGGGTATQIQPSFFGTITAVP